MKLESIKLHNFRRFKGWHTLDLDRSLTVLAANNGAGKSSLLDAVAIALGPFLSRLPKIVGNALTDRDLTMDHTAKTDRFTQIVASTYAEIGFGKEETPLAAPLIWDRMRRVKNAGRTLYLSKEGAAQRSSRDLKDINLLADFFLDHAEGETMFPVLAYYGTGRAVLNVPQRKRGFGKAFSRFQAYDGCLKPETNFKTLFEYFYFLEDLERREKIEKQNLNHQNRELDAIRAAVESCLPEYRNPHTGIHPVRFLIDRVSDGRSFSIEQLSDGYKTTLAMVMDIAIRMVEANPSKGAAALSASGIVLIDELELHLHPSWQQRIIPDLRRTFPNVQFICTTHSPQVLSTVPPESIRTISEEGRISKTSCKTYGAESKRVLEELMLVESRPNIHRAELKKFIRITDAGDWSSEDYHKLRSLLVDSLGESDPVLIEADIKKQFQELEAE